MADFAFDLTAEMRARLRGLAESCATNGTGHLAGANYHGQGRVDVPAQWLLELLGPEVDTFVVVREDVHYDCGLGYDGDEPTFYQAASERATRLSREGGVCLRVELFIPW